MQAPSFDPSPLLIKAPPIAGQPPRHRPDLQLSAQDSTDASQPPRHHPELQPSVPPQNSTDTQHPCEQNQESLRHSPAPPPPPIEPSPVQPPSSPSSSSSPTKPTLVPLTMTSVLQGAGVKVSHISQEISRLNLPNDGGHVLLYIDCRNLRGRVLCGATTCWQAGETAPMRSDV